MFDGLSLDLGEGKAFLLKNLLRGHLGLELLKKCSKLYALHKLIQMKLIEHPEKERSVKTLYLSDFR